MAKKIPEQTIKAVIDWFKKKLNGLQGARDNYDTTESMYKNNSHSQFFASLEFLGTANADNDPDKVAIFCDTLEGLLKQHDFEFLALQDSRSLKMGRSGVTIDDVYYQSMVLYIDYGPEDAYLREACEKSELSKDVFPIKTSIHIVENGDVVIGSYGGKSDMIFDNDAYNKKLKAFECLQTSSIHSDNIETVSTKKVKNSNETHKRKCSPNAEIKESPDKKVCKEDLNQSDQNNNNSLLTKNKSTHFQVQPQLEKQEKETINSDNVFLSDNRL